MEGHVYETWTEEDEALWERDERVWHRTLERSPVRSKLNTRIFIGELT